MCVPVDMLVAVAVRDHDISNTSGRGIGRGREESSCIGCGSSIWCNGETPIITSVVGQTVVTG